MILKFRRRKFYIRDSVHRNSRLKKSNETHQYADIYLLLNCSTCFGLPSRPSSEVHKAVVAASGTDHTIWGAGKQLSFFSISSLSCTSRQNNHSRVAKVCFLFKKRDLFQFRIFILFPFLLHVEQILLSSEQLDSFSINRSELPHNSACSSRTGYD